MRYPRPDFVIPYREPNCKYSSKPQGHSIGDKAEYIRLLSALLESNGFRERIEGIDQLVADCQDNPSMVIHSLFPARKTPPPLVNAHYFTLLSLIPFPGETTSCPLFGHLFPVSPTLPQVFDVSRDRLQESNLCNDQHQTYVYHCVPNEQSSDTVCFAAYISFVSSSSSVSSSPLSPLVALSFVSSLVSSSFSSSVSSPPPFPPSPLLPPQSW